ncbi:MAG TPA: hypothetical protein VKB05_08705 [Pyrinomonadaceae bacterium]|nr:hypothetical protein [Pyrinomonadaceae bacterium]
MDFPDKEMIRQMREIQRMMPTQEQLRMMEEMRRTANESRVQFVNEQTRLASEAIGGLWAMEHRRYLINQIRDIAELVAPLLSDHLHRELRPTLETIRSYKMRIAQEVQIARDVVASIASFQQNLTPDITETIKAISVLSDSPYRLALETIQNVDFHRSREFEAFVNAALRSAQSKPLTKKRLRQIKKKQLSKKKLAHLTPDEQFWLNFSVALLSVLIAVFSAIQAGKPIQIDLDQIERLTRPNVTINNFNLIEKAKPVTYLVDRPCTLRTKASWKGPVIAELSEGDMVEVIHAATNGSA